MNWKECTWKKEGGRDSGEIYVSITLYLSKIFQSTIITENNRPVLTRALKCT